MLDMEDNDSLVRQKPIVLWFSTTFITILIEYIATRLSLGTDAMCIN